MGTGVPIARMFRSFQYSALLYASTTSSGTNTFIPSGQSKPFKAVGGVVALTVTEVRLIHSLKIPPPILVTLPGIVMEVRLVQPLNADDPMLVTLSGIVIEVRLIQSENVIDPMLVTLPKIVMEVRFVHLLNVIDPMLITLSGIVMEMRLEQELNALSPILVTLYSTFSYSTVSGIITSVKAL